MVEKSTDVMPTYYLDGARLQRLLLLSHHPSITIHRDYEILTDGAKAGDEKRLRRSWRVGMGKRWTRKKAERMVWEEEAEYKCVQSPLL